MNIKDIIESIFQVEESKIVNAWVELEFPISSDWNKNMYPPLWDDLTFQVFSIISEWEFKNEYSDIELKIMERIYLGYINLFPNRKAEIEEYSSGLKELYLSKFNPN